MKHWKLAAAALSVGLSFLPAAARAADEPATQPATRPAGRLNPATMVERLKAALGELKLSDEQRAKIDAAIAKAKKPLDDLASGEGGENARARLQAAMKALDEVRDAVAANLDAEQLKALAEKVPFIGRRAATRPAATRPASDAGDRGGDRLAAVRRATAEFLEQVKLTDEQTAQLRALNRELTARAAALADEVRDDPAAIAEKLRPLLEERRAQLGKLLSDEQLAKYQELVMSQFRKARDAADGRAAEKGRSEAGGK